MTGVLLDIPKKLEGFLTNNEIVEQRFKLSEGRTAYATSKRLFILKGNSVHDIDYQHVSSVQMACNKAWWAIILGSLLVATGAVFISGVVEPNMEIDHYAGAGVAILAGLTIALFVFLFPNRSLNLNVVGLTKPYQLSGRQNDLDRIFKFVREKRV